MARKLGVPFLESSAKTRVNVEEAFFSAVREVGGWDVEPVVFTNIWKQ